MTKLLAVIGHPVLHSLSPRMHGAAIAALGADAVYVAIDIRPEALATTVRGLRRTRDVAGLNVTVPHKEAIVPLLDAVDEEARAIGAVNTVLIAEGRWTGTNTDARGLMRSLDEAGVRLEGARVGVIGAGGAARAAVFGARARGARVDVLARRAERAAALVAELAPGGGSHSIDGDLRALFASLDVVIQSSSATLSLEEGRALAEKLPFEALGAHATVVDLVYRPRITPVLEAARARGLAVVDGIGMLVHQGALALEQWLGARPSIDVMRRAVEDALAP